MIIVNNNVDIWNKTWAKFDEVEIDQMNRIIFENISKQVSFEGKSVLELGCGRGILSYLAYKSGAREITLVDFSDKALNYAENLFDGIEGISFIKADILNLDLNRTYDIVLSSGVVEHFKADQIIECIRSHIRHSNDLIVIVVPSNTYFNYRRSKSPENRKLYGWWKPISKSEMERHFKLLNVSIRYNRRFYTMYAVSFPNFRGVGRLKNILDVITTPIDALYGGLLLTIGEVKRK